MADAAGIAVAVVRPLHAATLRYFEAAGPFASAVANLMKTPLPGPLTALKSASGVILAWLRPTETLLLSETDAPLRELGQRLANVAGGHLVDLTGGVQVLRLHGARVSELLDRLGSVAMALPLHGARRGRLADVPVLALSVRAEEMLLVVERAYARHLSGWIDATLADFAPLMAREPILGDHEGHG
jgi:sarcosine oxidase gamma subunit